MKKVFRFLLLFLLTSHLFGQSQLFKAQDQRGKKFEDYLVGAIGYMPDYLTTPGLTSYQILAKNNITKEEYQKTVVIDFE